MNSDLDILSLQSMDLERSVRIIMPYYGTTRKSYNDTLVGLYVKHGRTALTSYTMIVKLFCIERGHTALEVQSN